MSEALVPVLRQINAAHGSAFALGERFPRGGQGACRLRDAAGAGFVLKWQPGETGLGALPAEVLLLDRLRAAGYPIPRYVAWGVLAAPAGRYTVQSSCPARAPGGSAGRRSRTRSPSTSCRRAPGRRSRRSPAPRARRPTSPGPAASSGSRARAATASASSTRCGPTRRRRRRCWRASRRTSPTTPRTSRPAPPRTWCTSTSPGRTSWSTGAGSPGSWTGAAPGRSGLRPGDPALLRRLLRGHRRDPGPRLGAGAGAGGRHNLRGLPGAPGAPPDRLVPPPPRRPDGRARARARRRGAPRPGPAPRPAAVHVARNRLQTAAGPDRPARDRRRGGARAAARTPFISTVWRRRPVRERCWTIGDPSGSAAGWPSQHRRVGKVEPALAVDARAARASRRWRSTTHAGECERGGRTRAARPPFASGNASGSLRAPDGGPGAVSAPLPRSQRAAARRRGHGSSTPPARDGGAWLRPRRRERPPTATRPRLQPPLGAGRPMSARGAIVRPCCPATPA